MTDKIPQAGQTVKIHFGRGVTSKAKVLSVQNDGNDTVFDFYESTVYFHLRLDANNEWFYYEGLPGNPGRRKRVSVEILT